MDDRQERYDEAMLDFSMLEYEAAIEKLSALVAEDPEDFDAQLSLGMAFYRKGDYDAAIREGLKAQRLRPHEQLVHTNLSLFYMKKGDKQTAEHHGLQARIASWREGGTAPGAAGDSGMDSDSDSDSELKMAQPKLENIKLPEKFPDMPWKKNAGPGAVKQSEETE